MQRNCLLRRGRRVGLILIPLLVWAFGASAEEALPPNSPPVAQCMPFSGHPAPGDCLGFGLMDIDGGSYDPDGMADIDDICIVAIDGSPVPCTYSDFVCGVGTHTVTIRITDKSGAFDECDATIVVYNDPPVAVCVPAYPPADGGCCAWVSVPMIDGGSYDPDPEDYIDEICIVAVDGAPVGCEWDVQVCGVQTHTVTLRITDGVGAHTECDAIVEIDNQLPIAECQNIGWPADPSCCVTVYCDDIDDGSYDPDGSLFSRCIIAVDGVSVGCQPSVDICGAGPHTVTMRVTDNCNETDSCDATVTLYNEYPVAYCRPYSEHGGENCCISVNVYDIDNGSYDPDGDITGMCIIAVDGDPVDCEQVVQVCGEGDHTVTMRVTDTCGWTDQCDATVTVENAPPVAYCDNWTAYPDYQCCITLFVDDIDDGSYDPDGADDIAEMAFTLVDATPVEPPSAIVPVCGPGEHWVTMRITDHCGQYDLCSSQITVLNDPPIAVCQPHWGYADENCCIPVTVADIDGGSYDPNDPDDIQYLCITAIDGVDVGCQEEVEVCEVGSHPVTLTVTDYCGATDQCDATVDVIDITPPEISVELNRYVLWPPNHKLADIIANVTVEDNCDPDPVVELVSVTSNEPDDDGGDGETDDDIQGADLGTEDYEFQLRSERSGKHTGRIYTIVYRATDFSGNSAEDVAFVRVPHDQDGMAFSSTGFTDEGMGFDRSQDEFVVVILSRVEVYGTAVNGKTRLIERLFDATQLDMSRTYVGNTMGVLVPQRWGHLDQNADGLIDLALYYRIAGVEPLVEQVQQTQFGEIWIGDPIDPVGLHYESANGVDYLVGDIFALGEPVELGAGSGAAGATDDRPNVLATTLFPVRPNPFTGSTTIRFNLATDEHVTLEVYDTRGGLVQTLAGGVNHSGMHQITWYGVDAGGKPVAPGVYFVRFTAGAFKTTEKMMLLK